MCVFLSVFIFDHHKRFKFLLKNREKCLHAPGQGTNQCLSERHFAPLAINGIDNRCTVLRFVETLTNALIIFLST